MALSRELGPATTTLLVVGQVIAVGIFLTPAAMVRDLIAPAWVLVVWVLMGGMAMCGALVFGELASRYPQAGGVYVYLREAWGPRVAFLYGWKCFLVMDPGLTAALAAGLTSYLPYVVAIGPRAQLGAGIAVIVGLALINIAGVRLGARVMALLSVAKLALLAIVMLAGILAPSGDWGHFVPLIQRPASAAPLVGALAGAIVSAFFSFGGWWEAGRMAGEVRDAQRILPRALVGGLAIITAWYALMTGLVTYAIPADRITSNAAFIAELGATIFGEGGARLLAAIVIISIVGSLAAFLMSAPRVYYAMAGDGVFPAALAKIDPVRGTPVRAILVQAALAVLILAAGRFETIVAYFVFITVVFLIAAVAGIYRVRRHDGTPPEFRVPGYPWTPLGFIVPGVLVVTLVAAGHPIQSLAGAAAVATGLLVWPRLNANAARDRLVGASGSIAGRSR
jgi:APA family basic amino acid/polyamine antiporter